MTEKTDMLIKGTPIRVASDGASPTLSKSPLGTLKAIFQAEALPPVDRRRALTVLGVTGMAGATAATIAHATQPDALTNVKAEFFRADAEASAAVERLVRFFEPSDAVADLSRRRAGLLERRAHVSYKWTTRESSQDCKDVGTGENKRRTCTTKYRDVTHYGSDSRVVSGDSLLTSIHGEELESKSRRLSHAQVAAFGLQKTNLLPAGYNGRGAPSSLSDDELAHAFNFQWHDEAVPTGSKVAVAAALGIPGTLLVGCYQPLLETLRKERSANGRTKEIGEIRATRRTVAQFGAAAVATGAALMASKWHDQRTAETKAMGRSGIRSSYLDTAKAGREEMFASLFQQMSPEGWADFADTLGTKLSRVTFSEVDAAVRHSINEVQSALTTLKLGARGSITSSSCDDTYDENAIVAYVNACRSVGQELKAKAVELRAFCQGGVPHELDAPLRAAFLTNKVNTVVGEQTSTQLWGLTRDLALTYGGAVGLLVASEMGLGDATVNAYVQAIFDLVDRGRMKALGVLSRLREELPAGHRQAVRSDELVRAGTDSTLAYLSEFMAEAAADAGVVHASYAQRYGSSLPDDAKAELDEQLSRLTAEDIIQVYEDKALVVLTNQQLGLKGVRNFKRRSDDAKTAIVIPSRDEFRALVTKLIEEGRETALFDLIQAGKIDDFEPDENWQTAEESDLARTLELKAERIAGTFTSMLPSLAAAKILPDGWYERRITAEEVLSIFVRKAHEVLAEKGGAETILREVQRAVGDAAGRLITGPEAAMRFALRTMDELCERHEETEVLLAYHEMLMPVVHEPKTPTAAELNVRGLDSGTFDPLVDAFDGLGVTASKYGVTASNY